MFELNKNFNLLDEQLAESGLEMTLEGVTTSLILGGISAGTSLIGGIFGAAEADKANRDAKKAAKQQQKQLNKIADATNKYNKKKFEVDKENYYKQREYNFETALKNWQYQTSIRAFQEKIDAQKYLMNVKNSNNQLTFNQIAEEQGLSREQLAVNDARAEDAFQRQDLLVARLAAEGKASLGQAGRSRAKTMQSNLAQIGRDLAVLDASLTGEIKQSNLSMFDISMGRYSADARVEAARMMRPERLPDIPAPTKPPEPTWIAPMKVIPGMAAAPVQQSVMAPLIQGIASAAGTAAQFDWNPVATAKQEYPGLPSNQQLGLSNPYP
jgi:hypothetical protein